jgi:DNA polymerase-1
MAADSHDEVLIRIIESGEDIHDMTFVEVFGKPKGYKPTQDERRIAKAINFGLIFGITAVGLARRLGIDVDTAQSYIDRYFRRFAGVSKFMTDVVSFARKNGYVVSLFKRRRRLINIHSDDKYEMWRAQRQAMNSPIQGESADFTYIVSIRVSNMLKKYNLKAKIVHSVHDCILVDTPPSEVEKVKKVIKVAFTKLISALPMKMDCDIEVNEMWGEHNESNLEVILKECGA